MSPWPFSVAVNIGVNPFLDLVSNTCAGQRLINCSIALVIITNRCV